MKYWLACLIYLLNRNKNYGVNGEIKSQISMIIKTGYPNLLHARLWFSLLMLDELLIRLRNLDRMHLRAKLSDSNEMFSWMKYWFAIHHVPHQEFPLRLNNLLNKENTIRLWMGLNGKMSSKAFLLFVYIAFCGVDRSLGEMFGLRELKK